MTEEKLVPAQLPQKNHAVIPITQSGSSGGLQLNSYEEVLRLTDLVTASGIVKDDDRNKARAMAAMKILNGMEMGLSPMTAINGLYVGPGGAIGMKAELVANEICKSGRYSFKTLYVEEEEASVEFFDTEDPNPKKPKIVTWNTAKAKAAGLLDGKNAKTWSQWLPNMLYKMCIMDGKRFYCQGLFNGITVYSTEELEAVEAQDMPLQDKVKDRAKDKAKKNTQPPEVAHVSKEEIEELQEMAAAAAGTDDVDVEEVAEEEAQPTQQEKFEAAAEVAKEQGLPEETVKTLEDLAKPGITGAQANALMKAGRARKWSFNQIIAGAVSKYKVEEKTWSQEITERQWTEFCQYVTDNDPPAPKPETEA
mgnify:CR=1 FL=1